MELFNPDGVCVHSDHGKMMGERFREWQSHVAKAYHRYAGSRAVLFVRHIECMPTVDVTIITRYTSRCKTCHPSLGVVVAYGSRLRVPADDTIPLQLRFRAGRRKGGCVKERTVAVSGGFDPLHVGHLRMIQAAKQLGTRLVVIVNADDFLMRKKGYVFMPVEERMEILRGLRDVDEVVVALDRDQTVRETLRLVRPDVFANGGDRRDAAEIPEAAVCRELGIEMVFNVGGGKVQSSSDLVQRADR